MNKTTVPKSMMIKLLTLILTGALLASCASAPPEGQDGEYSTLATLARGIHDQLMAKNIPRLALGDFLSDDGYMTLLGTNLARDFTTRFVAQGGVELVEREELEAALRETQFNVNQVLRNPQDIPNLGDFLPANAILVATLTPFDDYMRLDVRVFSTERGTILAAGLTWLDLYDDEWEQFEFLAGEQAEEAMRAAEEQPASSGKKK